MNISTEEYYQEVNSVIKEVSDLFLQKNKSYNPGSDPLLNFRRGGMIRHADNDYYGCYETLKDYVTKHIVNAMNKDIMAPDLAESTRDIAVYMIIATTMKRLWEKEHGERKTI
jgi:hypothetical protein